MLFLLAAEASEAAAGAIGCRDLDLDGDRCRRADEELRRGQTDSTGGGDGDGDEHDAGAVGDADADVEGLTLPALARSRPGLSVLVRR